MSDEVFRIVVTVAVGLATLAFLIQAGVVIALYRGLKKTQERVVQFAGVAEPVVARVGPLIDKAGPVIEKIGPVLQKAAPAVEKVGPAVDKVGVLIEKVTKIAATTNRIMEENRPRVSEFTGEAVAIAKSGRQEVERLGAFLHEASGRVQTRLEQIDHTVESTVGQVEHVGDAMKRAVTRPVKEVNGFAAGISAAVSTLVHGSRRSVESATQDEEMFI